MTFLIDFIQKSNNETSKIKNKNFSAAFKSAETAKKKTKNIFQFSWDFRNNSLVRFWILFVGKIYSKLDPMYAFVVCHGNGSAALSSTLIETVASNSGVRPSFNRSNVVSLVANRASLSQALCSRFISSLDKSCMLFPLFFIVWYSRASTTYPTIEECALNEQEKWKRKMKFNYRLVEWKDSFGFFGTKPCE